jgi:hypothetical protein
MRLATQRLDAMSHSSHNGGGPGGEGKPVPPFQAALADAARAFSKDPGGAARRLFDTAERALAGAAGAGGGRDGVSGLAAAASRFLSELQAPNPGRDAGTSGTPSPGGGSSAGPPADAGRGGDERAAPASALTTPTPTPFVELRQPSAGWSFHVRADAVEAVAPAGEEGCGLHLSDGSTMEAGQCSDSAARLLSGMARLSRAGTQQGVYVRPEAVLAVLAPAGGGCVLRLRGGRELAAAEAAAVAVGLLAGSGG